MYVCVYIYIYIYIISCMISLPLNPGCGEALRGAAAGASFAVYI